MNLDERTALMDDIRNRYRANPLTPEEIDEVKRRLNGYARAGNKDERGSLAETAFNAADAIGFLQYDLIDALNEVGRLRGGAAK